RASWRLVFFFQAEDGIRDYKVTGVQTCALPISVEAPEALHHPCALLRHDAHTLDDEGHDHAENKNPGPVARQRGNDRGNDGECRSEERRVGKECGRWRCPWQERLTGQSDHYNFS